MEFGVRLSADFRYHRQHEVILMNAMNRTQSQFTRVRRALALATPQLVHVQHADCQWIAVFGRDAAG